jgi:hypothetical protein
MGRELLGQWPFGKSKLDLKQSSLRRVRSSNLKLAYFLLVFWLLIQNTADRQVRNLFISFPLARAAAAAIVAAADFCCCCCAPRPHPAPFILGEGSTKKKIASSVEGWRLDKFASAWARSVFYLRFSWVIIIMPGALFFLARRARKSWTFAKFRSSL